MKNFTILLGKRVALLLTALVFVIFFTGCSDDDFVSCVDVSVSESNPPQENLDTATSWMADAKWGIGHHYISNRFGLVGQYGAWREYVNNFNVSTYAELAKKLGAGWVLIHALSDITNTTSDIYDQNSPPCTSKYPECVHQQGTNRADYTGDRDLVLDLAKALHKKGILMMVYFTTDPIRGRFTPWETDYDASNPLWWTQMIEEKSREWGTYVSGWIFDSYIRFSQGR